MNDVNNLDFSLWKWFGFSKLIPPTSFVTALVERKVFGVPGLDALIARSTRCAGSLGHEVGPIWTCFGGGWVVSIVQKLHQGRVSTVEDGSVLFGHGNRTRDAASQVASGRRNGGAFHQIHGQEGDEHHRARNHSSRGDDHHGRLPSPDEW